MTKLVITKAFSHRFSPEAKGFAMFGTLPSGKWFERWFATEAAAVAYCKKRGYLHCDQETRDAELRAAAESQVAA